MSVYTRGNFTLDVERRHLSGPRGEVLLRDQPMVLAEALFRTEGRWLSPDKLICLLWPDPGAEPETVEVRLRQAVAQLRQALRVVGTNHDPVRFERGAGYRLEARGS